MFWLIVALVAVALVLLGVFIGHMISYGAGYRRNEQALTDWQKMALRHHGPNE